METLKFKHTVALARSFALIAATLLGLACFAQSAAADTPAVMHEDARLNDICVIDDRLAWAVGDRGTIWHSADGGQNWRLQTSGVDCSLDSVCFLTPSDGWAVGGFTQPYTHTTTGVVLRTRDGGQHWQREPRLLLPRLNYVKFIDQMRGWAVGSSTSLFASSVFTTDDGGRSWAALPASHQTDWTAADFLDEQSGALAGAHGRLSYLRRKTAEPAKTANLGLRGVTRLRLSPGRGWLVGDGGLVLTTSDRGINWGSPTGELPTAGQQFDFRAVAVRGNLCWIAGAPGTKVFHSADGGKSWTTLDTNHCAPLRALAFVDGRRGYAVGDLGAILLTTDGGQSWRRARGTHSRAAVLNLLADSASTPLELVAHLSGDHGYLSATEIISRSDVQSPDTSRSVIEQRTQEATALCGGSSASIAWRFPLRPTGVQTSAKEFLDGWNLANDGHGYDRLIEHLVGRIRQWRPELIVTSSPSSSSDPLDQLIAQSVLQAAEYAADRTRYSHQLIDAGLQPWQVKRVYARLPSGERGLPELTTAQLSPRLGGSIADTVSSPQGLLTDKYAPVPATVPFRLLFDRQAADGQQRDFFSGIAVAPGGDARRMLTEAADRQLETVRRGVQAKRNLQSILARVDERTGGDERLSAELSDVTRSMNSQQASEVLAQLANRYDCRGQWELAAQNYGMLAEQYPDSPLAAPALVWLIQYHSSAEATWRIRQSQSITAQQVTATADSSKNLTKGGDFKPGSNVRRSNRLVSALRGKGEPSAAAAGYAKQLEQRYPTTFAEPHVRFPLAVGQRSRGYPREAERFFLAFRRSRPEDAWTASAQAEQWIIDGAGTAPKPIARCARFPRKPRLDGKLDEPIWKLARPIELTSPLRDDTQWPATAIMAYDDQFLYLAAVCRRPTSNAINNPTDKKQARDSDLVKSDRIEFTIDIDRDYTTYYRLAVDATGSIADRCWNDGSWNPSWYSATTQSDDAWTVESAIPLSDLSGTLPESKHVWAIGVQRVAPGTGFQSWTQPASTEIVPEGFGLLLFE